MAEFATLVQGTDPYKAKLRQAREGLSPAPAGSGGTNYSDLLDMSKQWSEAVSAANFAQADKQMQFQERANAKAMAFNAAEAEKARNWQERMSNTAHQREVQDLISAGLNPILSATGGNGAAVTSGAAASGVTSAGAKGDADASAAQTLSSVAAGLIQQMTQQQLQVKDLENKMDIAQLQTDVQRYLGELTAATGLEGVGISANAAKTAAWLAAQASQYSSDTQYRINRDFPSNPYRALFSLGGGSGGVLSSARDFLSGKVNPLKGTVVDKAASKLAHGVIKLQEANLKRQINTLKSDINTARNWKYPRSWKRF